MMDTIKKIITNFSIGIVVLIVSYIILYYMGGKSAYNNDISSFNDVNSLIMQCLEAGIFYIVFDKILKYFIKFVSPEYAKEMTFKKMFTFLFVVLIGIPLITLILKFTNIPKNVQLIYYFNIIMLMIIVPIITLLTQYKDVTKINKALKNRNETT